MPGTCQGEVVLPLRPDRTPFSRMPPGWRQQLQRWWFPGVLQVRTGRPHRTQLLSGW
ncbi:Zinc finger, CCHC-type [Penicillium camemberti]|uniref:Zinc finger, CCHC-type n=1 Tax=Penicillium camemberti (strain FM 013) TaxID=1429867 RepID=A0A0G4P6S1_PENC3|nr:Zinc finger, CCHC-type [Penicillium camemberti]